MPWDELQEILIDHQSTTSVRNNNEKRSGIAYSFVRHEPQ
jgi:hypothetical protein